MTNNRDGGKGDSPRPIQNREKFETNWDTIFKNGIPTLEELEKQREQQYITPED
jgi:hypothetical protein